VSLGPRVVALGGDGASPGVAQDAVAGPTAVRVRPARPAHRQRALGFEHFAFMRAVLQGLDLKESWDRYLRVEGDGRDLRRIQSTVNWIRDEFAAAARRERRHGTARLVRMEVSGLAHAREPLPSLASFAAENGLEEFSEHEQVAAYEQAFGRAGGRSRRRQILVARQLEALHWLERLVVQPPALGDSVHAWLHPDLARLLESAGVRTLAHLVDRVNGIGQGWHAGIRALGPTKAGRVLDWLRQHEKALGCAIAPHVARPRRQLTAVDLGAVVTPATAVRPLEKFLVPPALDGRRGLNRAPAEVCVIPADNDSQAVQLWLRAKQGSDRQSLPIEVNQGERSDQRVLTNTQRAYRKEVERFLLWVVLERKKALSSVDGSDCEAYRQFMADPQPRERWCGPRARERWSPLWRPFEGPLSPAAQRHAAKVLSGFYAFLVDRGYLIANPWRATRKGISGAPLLNTDRTLTDHQWHFVEGELAGLPKTSANRRLRLAMRLTRATGLRASELCAARVDDLSQPWGHEKAPLSIHDAPWHLRVVGRGQRVRIVPVPSHLIAELSDYLVSRGLHADPTHTYNRGAHLLGKAADMDTRAPALFAKANVATMGAKSGVNAKTLYDQMVACFSACARALAKLGDKQGAAILARASTHWLRHAHAHDALRRGESLDVLQQRLGHASLTTTAQYLRPQEAP